jgi:capsular exopolysaccharide synthesis family protein
MTKQGENYGTVEHERSNAETPPTVAVVSESLVRIIWRGRWIVLLVTAVALAATFAYLSKATPIYTSTSRIYVAQTGPRIISETEEGVMTQATNYLYTQAELLTSVPILSSALNNLDVEGMKIFSRSDNAVSTLRKWLESVPLLSSALGKSGAEQTKTLSRIDNPVAYLKDKLEVSVGKNDSIINVSFDSPYPAENADLVNAVVDSYKAYHAASKRNTAAEIVKILQKEKVQQDNELAKKLRAMMDFKKENVTLAFEDDTGNIILDRLDRLTEALTQAQLQTAEAKSAYETTKSAMADSRTLKQFVEAEMSRAEYGALASERNGLRQQLNQLQHQLADLAPQLTPDHPSVQALQGKFDRVKAQFDQLDRQFAEARLAIVEQQYLAAKQKQEQIQAHVDKQRQAAIDLNKQVAQYTILRSEYEQTRALSALLEGRIRDLSVTEEAGALNISVLELARPADKPSSPQKVRYMALALVLGLLVGVGLAFLRDWRDDRFRSLQEVGAVLGVPVLGTVPKMLGKRKVSRQGQAVRLRSASQAAEAYRDIRTAVFFGLSGNGAKTLLVTSPNAGDGKTIFASNLAIAMSQAGQRVLIIDANFRKPMQDTVFEVGASNGLADLIAGNVRWDEAIRPTVVGGLDILPAGSEVSNPSEMLSSSAFSRTLKNLASRYERIIIDSPSVIPMTDARILGALSDVTVLILRAKKSTRAASHQARDCLSSVGAHLLGVVVSGVSKKNGRYGHNGDYRYYRTRGNQGQDHQKTEKVDNKKSAAVTEEVDTDGASED